jgi:hypothetical protein
MTLWGGKDHFEALKLLRLPHKSRGHICPYPRVTFAPTPNWGRGKCDPTWGRGKCDPRAVQSTRWSTSLLHSVQVVSVKSCCFSFTSHFVWWIIPLQWSHASLFVQVFFWLVSGSHIHLCRNFQGHLRRNCSPTFFKITCAEMSLKT